MSAPPASPNAGAMLRFSCPNGGLPGAAPELLVLATLNGVLAAITTRYVAPARVPARGHRATDDRPPGVSLPGGPAAGVCPLHSGGEHFEAARGNHPGKRPAVRPRFGEHKWHVREPAPRRWPRAAAR